MSAPTATVEYLLARAALRAGLMHLVSRRNTGALNPVCGANPVRSSEIQEWTAVPADLSALCADCAALAMNLPGVDLLEQGLATFLGGSDAPTVLRLLEVPVDAIALEGVPRLAGGALVASVRRDGVVQPVVVRRTPAGLQLVSGRRRLDAARSAGLATIPAIVRELDDEQTMIGRLVENLHRQDLDPIAQAHAYADAMSTLALTQEALADRIQISRTQVANTVRLLGLPPHLQELLATGLLTAAHGRALLRLNGRPDEQDTLADQIVAESMTTKDTDAAVRRIAVPAPVDPALAEIALSLKALLEARVKVTTITDGTRITIDVADAQRAAHVLEQLGMLAAAA